MPKVSIYVETRTNRVGKSKAYILPKGMSLSANTIDRSDLSIGLPVIYFEMVIQQTNEFRFCMGAMWLKRYHFAPSFFYCSNVIFGELNMLEISMQYEFSRAYIGPISIYTYRCYMCQNFIGTMLEPYQCNVVF